VGYSAGLPATGEQRSQGATRDTRQNGRQAREQITQRRESLDAIADAGSDQAEVDRSAQAASVVAE
jgi:hypothetical protein